jgi:hypothetical protein
VAQGNDEISLDSAGWASSLATPVELRADARGVLRVGDTKVLFECIAEPVRSRPQLPLGLRRSLRTTVDWTATVMVAFSFLVHFGGLASLYSDFGDTIVRDDASVIGLVEQFKTLPIVPVSTVDPAPTAAAEVPHERAKIPLPSALKPRAPITNESGSSTPSATRPKTISREQGLAMLDQLQSGNTALIASLQPGQSSASAGVLLDGNVPSDSLDRFASSDRGARPSSLLKMDGDSGAPMIPGQTRDLSDLVPRGPSVPIDAPAPPCFYAPPKPVITAPKPVSTCQLGRVEATLAGVRGTARASYSRALLTQPQAEGKVSYTLSIGPDGRVSSASVSSSGTLPPDVANTIRGALQSLRFDMPAECSAASISGSFAFVNGR